MTSRFIRCSFKTCPWVQRAATVPQFPAPHQNLGNLLLGQERSEEALAHYKTAATLSPNSADAYFGLGAACCKLGKTDQAIANYRKAIEINPKMARAYNNLGVELEKKGRIDEAKDQYLKALKVDPKNEDARRNLERFQGGSGGVPSSS